MTEIGVPFRHRCTPQSSIFVGFSLVNQPFWGSPFMETPFMETPIYGNPHLWKPPYNLLWIVASLSTLLLLARSRRPWQGIAIWKTTESAVDEAQLAEECTSCCPCFSMLGRIRNWAKLLWALIASRFVHGVLSSKQMLLRTVERGFPCACCWSTLTQLINAHAWLWLRQGTLRKPYLGRWSAYFSVRYHVEPTEGSSFLAWTDKGHLMSSITFRCRPRESKLLEINKSKNPSLLTVVEL